MTGKALSSIDRPETCGECVALRETASGYACDFASSHGEVAESEVPARPEPSARVCRVAAAKRKREPQFWTCEESAERFHCRSVREAVEEYLDQCDEDPKTLTAYGYAPLVIDESPLYGCVLDHLLETLEEEYGDMEGHLVNEPTVQMREAAKAFVNTVVAGFRVWICELVCQEVVDVAEWRANGGKHDRGSGG